MTFFTAMKFLLFSSLFALCHGHAIDQSHYIAQPVFNDKLVNNEQREVFVHLFNQRYSEIQKECKFLGSNGFKAIQISPPNESLLFSGNPWWQHYQPKSYTINSRFGTRSDLQSLTKECDSYGVDIYVDGVINHMGAGSTEQFKDTWDPATSYHLPICAINDYCDHKQVRFCQLVGLNDLATETEPVRATLVNYLNDCMSLGVNGFRFDASKHMWPADMQNIVSRLSKNSRGENPPVFQEVIRGSSCEILPDEYFGTSATARVTEFAYAGQVASKITSGSISDLVTSSIGQSWGLVPDNRAVVFIDNHDTERHDAPLTYKSGNTYFMSVAFMVAFPFGYPKVLSGFEFLGPDDGAPQDGSGTISPYDCDDVNGNKWTCTHRFRPVAAAALWRAVTSGSSKVDNVFTQGTSIVGFSRSGKGYIIFNTSTAPIKVTVKTGMPSGYYCDTASGDNVAAGCTGSMIHVAQDGTASISVPAYYISVIHVNSKTNASCVDSKTCSSCNSSGYKVDCGYAGIVQGQCEAAGCCWVPSAIPNEPWCFSKNNQSLFTSLLRGGQNDMMSQI